MVKQYMLITLSPSLNSWMVPDIEDICSYEDLDQEKLESILVATGIPTLKEMRKTIPEDIKEKRNEYVTCSGYWKIN